MPVRTVNFGVLIEDDLSVATAIDYAIGLCEAEGAHLTCTLAAPVLDLPTARLVSVAHALVDQVNAERLAKARETEAKIEAGARLSGVPFDCRIVQKHYLDARAAQITSARASDLVVLPQARGSISLAAGLIEGVLFESGRPAIVVPEGWSRGATMKKIVIAWDGGARAARAVGDVAPLLARAEEVEVVCVLAPDKPAAVGADLARHLVRHCANLKLTDLPVSPDAGRTLSEHVANVRADLLVMGAYGHSRLLQFILGGVTQTMLSEARLPVFFSY